MQTTGFIETLWFLDGMARVRGAVAGPGTVELTMPHGATAPLHVQDEDETVFVLDGRVEFEVEGETRELRAGDSLVVRAGDRHAYRVVSRSGARWEAFTPNGRYARFVQEIGRATGPAGHPPVAPRTSLHELVALTVAAAGHGIEIVGTPASLQLAA
jgi:quercetin dioxygenase-like cupin family protein